VSAADDAGAGGLESFREKRRRSVVAPQGNLALVNTQWITGDVEESRPVRGVPGLWSPLPGGLSGLRLTATAADGIRVDDELVDGSVIVAGMDALAPSRIRFSTSRTGTIIADEAGGYALRVWDAQSDGIRAFGSIDVVFGDSTNGVYTYSMGRFLRVARGEDGSVILDFNRAYLPPCAFSYNFNCPIPPARNRLPFAVEAGERNVLAKGGGLLH